MEPEQTSRLGVAVAISVGVHILFAVVAEVGSSPRTPRLLPAPPVEITRVAADGTALPTGKGNAAFNSPSSTPNNAFGREYQLDAGVPMKINTPAPQTSPNTLPQPQKPTNPQNQIPVNQSPATRPQSESNPPSQRNPNEFYPPVNSGTQTGQGNQSSPPSQPSTAGNQGQRRSRGPNRVAFPEYTVEPNVSQSMIGNGVTNSVDVSVSIAADGSHTEQIVRSSGSTEVDNLVLDALKQWRWDPAAREGAAIASTQNFKFTFKPR